MSAEGTDGAARGDAGGRGARRGALRVLLVGEVDLSHGALLERLAAALAAQPGVEVRVRPVPEPNRAEARLIMRVAALGRWDLQPLRWRLRYSARARWLLERDRSWADVALVNTQSCALLATGLMRRLPTALSVDFTGRQYDRAGYGTATAGPLAAALERRAFARSAAVLAWTRTTASSVREEYGVPPARVRELHPGIDVDAWRVERVPAPEGAPLRVLFVGNDVERKGLRTLLEARRLSAAPVELHVVTGDDVPAEAGVHVHRGLRPGSAELLARFAAADVFALPTTADAVPWVVLEAMAAGLPVVATDVGAIPELLGGTGVVVPVADVAALAAALARLAADPGRRLALGRRAAERARTDFSSVTQVPRLVDVLRSCAARAPI